MMSHLCKKPLTKVIFLHSVCAIVLISCGKEAIDSYDCSGFEPAYKAEIKPILDGSCALSGCHDAAAAKNGIRLDSYATAASESRNERFLGSIQHKRGFKSMPEEAARLSDEKIELITCWVQSGSLE